MEDAVRNLACLSFLLLFLLSHSAAYAEETAVPKSYAECKKSAPYTEKTDLKCTYLVPIDKSNNQQTKDYFACQSAKPNWEFLRNKYQCEFADYDDKSAPRFARCMRDKSPPSFPKFTDDCRIFYYNPEYVFPATLESCMAKEDRHEDMTYELKQICMIKLSYAPETPGEVYDGDEANTIIEKCQLAGGQAELVDMKYPECRLVYVEK